MASQYYTPEHEAFRETVRRFVEAEIKPYIHDWDEAGSFPRELYNKAANIGILQLGYEEQYGGIDADLFFSIVAFQELARSGSGGLTAGLTSHTIGTPPIAHAGGASLKSRLLPAILSGEKISALAISEPHAGSDVANLKTTARRDGDDYVINGTKTFITSGMRADVLTVAVRTGGPGSGGVSLIVVEGDAPGLARTPLKKMGWWVSDTATLYFDDVRVPAENLLGEENKGFALSMRNFNAERITLAAVATALSQVCLDDVVAYARERETFGSALIKHQVIRHKLVDMAMRINATQAWLEQLAWRAMQGDNPVAEISMLKNQSSLTMEFCAREAVQIFGGAGYMRGPAVERIYREVRVNAIGGGAEEIMRDLAARQMGW